MIDSHCHLTDPRLAAQLPQVLPRAAEAGVSHMLTIGADLPDDRACIDLCRRLPNLRCAVGVHPNSVKESDLSALDELRQIQSDPAVLALGEMGLDYHYGSEQRNRQIQFFRGQLQIARELDRPVVIHCRQAMDDCLAIMRDFPSVRAVFHCFTGSVAEARRILDAGYWLGLTGVVTFKNPGQLREVAALIPADRLLLETDAPYLSPEPMRKIKVNEPAFVVHVAAVVARTRNVSIDQIDRLTTANVRQFFKWEL